MITKDEGSIELPSTEWKYLKGISVEDYFLRLYESEYLGTKIYKQTETGRDLLGLPNGKIDTFYFFEDEEFDREFFDLNECLRYIKQYKRIKKGE